MKYGKKKILSPIHKKTIYISGRRVNAICFMSYFTINGKGDLSGKYIQGKCLDSLPLQRCSALAYRI